MTPAVASDVLTGLVEVQAVGLEGDPGLRVAGVGVQHAPVPDGDRHLGDPQLIGCLDRQGSQARLEGVRRLDRGEIEDASCGHPPGAGECDRSQLVRRHAARAQCRVGYGEALRQREVTSAVDDRSKGRGGPQSDLVRGEGAEAQRHVVGHGDASCSRGDQLRWVRSMQDAPPVVQSRSPMAQVGVESGRPGRRIIHGQAVDPAPVPDDRASRQGPRKCSGGGRLEDLCAGSCSAVLGDDEGDD